MPSGVALNTMNCDAIVNPENVSGVPAPFGFREDSSRIALARCGAWLR
jgi:hypothetical protein